MVVDRAKLEAYRVSLAEVVNALGRENVDAPAGAADRGATEALVRWPRAAAPPPTSRASR